jgi:hypothetical protein
VDDGVLLDNGDGTIRIVDERCLVCVCETGEFDFAIRGIAFIALAAGSVVTLLAGLGYAPRLLLLVSGTWLVGAIVALAVSVRQARRYGRFELDGAAGELRQLRRGKLVRTIALAEVRSVSTAADRVGGTPGSRFDVAPKWVTLHLRSGEELRLGRGMPWQLPPVLRAIAELGIERR